LVFRRAAVFVFALRLGFAFGLAAFGTGFGAGFGAAGMRGPGGVMDGMGGGGAGAGIQGWGSPNGRSIVSSM